LMLSSPVRKLPRPLLAWKDWQHLGLMAYLLSSITLTETSSNMML
jgi:hypothetical protein